MKLKQTDDFGTVRSVYEDVIRHTPDIGKHARWEYGRHPTDEGLRTHIRNGEMYLLTDGDRIAGAAVIVMRQGPEYEAVPWAEKLDNDQVATVHLLAVRPEYRGQSLSLTILELACGLAKQKGRKAVRLDVLESNLPARRIYERAGFELRGRQRWYAENTGWTDFLLYEKKLNEE